MGVWNLTEINNWFLFISFFLRPALKTKMLLLCDLDYIYVLTFISNCAANICENSKLPWNTVHYLLKIKFVSHAWFWLLFGSRSHLSGTKDDMNFIIHSPCGNVKNFTYANLPFHRKYKENVLYVENVLYANYLSFFKVDVM